MGRYNSFVVHIWSDDDGHTRGTIEHVRTRESLVFLDPGAMLPFIHRHLVQPARPLPDEPLEPRDRETSPDE